MFRCRFGLCLLLTIFYILLFVSRPASAANVSGIIDTDTTWTLSESPYRVVGNIRVSEEATLTIEPGVTVRFQRNVNAAEGSFLLVEGTLNAQGTVDDPIIFTAVDRLSPWGGLLFMDSSKDWDDSTSSGCILDNCVIEYAGNTTSYGAACVQTFSAQPMIRNNTIRYGSSVGISATDILLAQTLSGRLQILSNRIHNHAVGIRLNLEGALIQNNFLINNAQGMDIRTSSNDIVVQSNTIINDAPQLIGAAMNLSMDLVDTDNGIAAYTWTQTAGPVVDLEDPHSPFGTFTAPIVGAATETIVFDLSVTDDDGLTDSESVEILVIGTNIPPVARAGADQAVEIGTEVQLSAVGSFDPDKGIAAYQWTQTAGSDVTLSDDQVINPTFLAPTVAPEGEVFTFEVLVTDTEGLEATDSVDILVFDTNIPPTADAGVDLFVFQEASVELDGSLSVDPDGSIATYSWIQTEGASVNLEDAETVRPYFSVPTIGADPEAFTFALTVVDNQGLEAQDTVTITIFGELIRPFSDPGSDQIVSEDSAVLLWAFNSFDLDRKALVSVQSNLMRCREDTAGIIAINLADARAGYDLKVSANQFEMSANGGLAVYLYGWPPGITDPEFTLSDNWWGTTDTEIIADLIYDKGEDFNLPVIVATPAATPPVAVGSTLTYPSMANAGPDIEASADLAVSLDGSGTYDPDGIAVYTWTQVDGPAVVLKDADSATASFVTPLGGDEGESLTFQLKVRVGDAVEDTDDAVVTVSADEDLPTVDLDDWPTCFIQLIVDRIVLSF